LAACLSKYRHYTHTWIHETLVDLLAIQKEIHPGILAVMDGTTAGDGAGPRMIRPVAKDIILASSDQVAIDAVAARLMGFDPLGIRYIRLAHEQRLGVGDPRQIQVVATTYRDRAGVPRGPQLPQLPGLAGLVRPTRVLTKAGAPHPAGDRPHPDRRDRAGLYLLAFKYRAIARRWRDSAAWGHLFQQYQQRGWLMDEKVGCHV